MKIASLLLKILLGTVVTIMIAVGVIVATVDPNDYRTQIADVVKKETGRDLQIESISLSLFPNIGLSLENTTLSNAKGFSKQAFFHIDEVVIGAAIMPLLSQTLEIDTLTLHGLQLSLEKNTQGVSNWDDLVEPSTKETPENDKNSPLSKLAGLDFGGIDIQQGQINWNDAQTKQSVALNITQFTTEAITFGQFFKINLSAKSQVAKPALTAQLDLEIEAKLNQDGGFALRNLALKTSVQGRGIPVEKASANLAIASIDLALDKQQITLPSLKLNYTVVGGQYFPAQSIKGGLQLADFSADIAAQEFSTKQLDVNTDLVASFLPNGKGQASLSVQPTLNLQKQTATLNNLTLTALGIQSKGSVTASQITSNPIANAQLEIAQINLRQLLTDLKITLPEMADTKTLTEFSGYLGVHFNAKTESLKIQKLNLKLDESQLTGSASVKQFATPNIAYDLALNKIDLNRYLPIPKEQPKVTQKSDKELIITLPTELLRKLTINGRLKVGEVKFKELLPKDILVTINGAKGNIKAAPVSAKLFKRQVNVEAGLDVRGKTPKYSLKMTGKQIPVGKVLVAVLNKDILNGNGSVDLNITTAGTRIIDFTKHLNGKASVDLLNGAVKGFNLAQIIRNAKAKLNKSTADASKENLQTDFSAMTAQVTIKNGVVTTKKLTAQAPFMRITGSGTVNLPQESLDYLVRTKIVASDKGQGGEELKELNGLTLPVRLKGSYLSPDITLDLASLLEQKTKMELQSKLDAKKKEISDELSKKATQAIEENKKELGNQLKDSLFKGFKF
ncbi:MAG: AsmA protein [Thiomicrorhabdus sp.]|nr:MAG: AsmA protein [Thiomicrorhabdus sp.]